MRIWDILRHCKLKAHRAARDWVTSIHLLLFMVFALDLALAFALASWGHGEQDVLTNCKVWKMHENAGNTGNTIQTYSNELMKTALWQNSLSRSFPIFWSSEISKRKSTSQISTSARNILKATPHSAAQLARHRCTFGALAALFMAFLDLKAKTLNSEVFAYLRSLSR